MMVEEIVIQAARAYGGQLLEKSQDPTFRYPKEYRAKALRILDACDEMGSSLSQTPGETT